MMSATYEQQYKHILEEFVEYCKQETERIINAELFDEILNEFIDMKMERYNAKTE